MSMEETGRLRDLFAGSQGVDDSGSDCPPPDILWSSAREGLAAPANEEIVLHLGVCGACAAAWRLARDLDARPTEVQEMPRPVPVPVRKAWLPVAAAAAIIVMLAALTLLVRPGGEAGLPPAELRTQQGDWLRPTMPEGSLSREDAVLRWTAGPDGSLYDVRVTTEDLEILGRGWRLSEPTYRMDPAALATLPENASIHWQVTAHLPDGRMVDSPTFTTALR